MEKENATGSNATESGKSKAPPSPEEWASDTQLARRYSVSRATIWRWVKEGNIPAPRKLTRGCTRWRLADVIASLELAR